MDFDKITVNDWTAFVNNNNNITTYLENMYISSMEMEATTKNMSEIIKNAYSELGNLRVMKITTRSNVDSLYVLLQSYQQQLSSKIGESAAKIFIGLCGAEELIHNYNIDSTEQDYINGILNGNLQFSEKELSTMSLIIAAYSPILAHAVTKVDYIPSLMESGEELAEKSAAKSLLEKGASFFIEDAEIEEAAGCIFSAYLSVAEEMVKKHKYNNIDIDEYDSKDIVDIYGAGVMGTVSYFITTALTAELGPVGTALSIPINYGLNKVVKPVFEYAGDLATDNFESDSFEIDGKKYTVYYNGSGNHKKASEILGDKKDSQKKENEKYVINGVSVPKSRYKCTLYTNPEEIAPTSNDYQEDWNNLNSKLNSCQSEDEAAAVFEEFKTDHDNNSNASGFISYISDLQNNYDWNVKNYWTYMKNTT